MIPSLNAFLTAVMLLTRVPVGRWVRFSPEAASASVFFFPLVGALVGSVTAGVWWLTSGTLPSAVAVLLTILSPILLTGALHEDGLADAADGLFGGHTPEQRMTIMKDSRMGTFGGIALWFSLTLRFVLLMQITLRGISFTAWALLWAHTLARCAAVGLLQTLAHVGPDASRAKDFCRKLPLPALLLTLIIPAFTLECVFPDAARLAIPSLSLLVLLASLYLRAKLGGLTGDCVGATTQLAELCTLCCFVASR